MVGIGLRNFKSVRFADVRFGPLTVIAGSNSAGKSSLIQSVLALTQVTRRRIDGRRFPLNDELTRLGTFTSLRHQTADPIEPVVIAVRFASDERDVRRNVEARARFGDAAREPERDRKELPVSVRWAVELDSPVADQIGSAQISGLEVALIGDGLDLTSRIERTSQASLVRSNQDDIVGALAFSGVIRSGSLETPLLDAVISSGQVISFFGVPPDAPVRVHDWFLAVQDHADEAAQTPLMFERDRAIQQAAWAVRWDVAVPPEFATWYLSLNQGEQEAVELAVLTAFESDRWRFRQSRGGIERLEGRGPAWLGGAQQACARYLATQVRYVGPLRHAPHLPFGTAPDPDAGDVGIAGEHVAAVLQANRSLVRQFPVPPEEGVFERKRSERLSLEQAVNRWLSYFGLADSLTVRERAPLVLEIDLVPPGLAHPVSLSAVGVGVSQVLPVVVQCLVAGPGALVILEQPELHLHPGAQQLLADFLLACTDWGQNILVESHSEYLVLRLRRRIAQDLSDSLLKHVVILFAERDPAGATTYRPVELTPTGGVVDWPDGFFDQGPDEAHQLLIAAADRQRRVGGDIIAQ
ncbi:MAG: DUF3696 domain-containing protein [Acidimicrobiales bacterium]